MTTQFLRSRNYPPSERLGAYVARHYVFSVEAPESFELIDRLLSETAFVRFLVRGDWAAEVEPEQWNSFDRVVFCGPNSRPLRVRVRGGFRVIGIAFCPAAWGAFSDNPADMLADRIAPVSGELREPAFALLREVETLTDETEQGDAAIVAAVERHLTGLLDARGWPEPDAAMQRFETIARNQSTALVRDIAEELGLSQRNFERRCRATFGMSPKAVLRRSRFLDMAAAMRGMSSPDDRELAALRYYDQPQLIREFRHYIGLTPGKFAKTPTPLLDAGLELRELRKQEDTA